MIVNRSEDERDVTWRLGANELQCQYRGIWMSPKICEKIKNEKIGMTNEWVAKLGNTA